MQKFTWLDSDDETILEAELASLEEDQAFLEHYYGVSMLLSAIGEAGDELEDGLDLDFDFDNESIAS